MIMNFQTYVMIGAAVFALALNLYMKFQDKKAGVTANSNNVAAANQAAEKESVVEEENDSFIFKRFDPGYIGVFSDPD